MPNSVDNDNLKTTLTWYSPFSNIETGTEKDRVALHNIDAEIRYLEALSEELKRKRQETGSKGSLEPKAYSTYLKFVEDQRRVEAELENIRNERLKFVLRAGFAYCPDKRGDHFPHSTLEEHAKAFLQTQKERLIAVSTVAFFGAAISYSTVFSAARGSIGLMSLSWTAFSLSFSLCIYAQWSNPKNPDLAVVTHPHFRVLRVRLIFFAGFSSFVGIVLMSVNMVILDVRWDWDGSPKGIDTSINTFFGGGLSLLAVAFAFCFGCWRLWFHMREAKRLEGRVNRLGILAMSV